MIPPIIFGIFLISYSLYTPLPTHSNEIQFYSTHNHDDLHLTLHNALKKAKKSIYLKSYAITDISTITLLKKKAKEGVEVHLYYHKKTSPQLNQLKRSSFYLHPIEEKGLMHEKIWIIDEKQIFLGSANITYSSLKMHENCMLGLFSPKFAQKLIESRPNQFTLDIKNNRIEFYSLPSKESLNVLLNQIGNAKLKITLSLFTFTHPLLVQKLIEVHKKGVIIHLIVDGYTARGASKQALNTLKKAGIKVQCTNGPQLFHHKWGLIDECTLILGSANWTKAAFTQNKDFILFLSPLNKKIIKNINKSIKNSNNIICKY